MGNMKYKNGGQKLLNKMAQYGYEVTPGNTDVKPMISAEEVKQIQKDYSNKVGSYADYNKPSSMINPDNKYGQFTSSKKPAKKMQIGGQSPSVTYSGPKKK